MNAVNPDVPEIPEIDVTDLARVLDEGAPLIDVRMPDEYEQAHVPGARLIPLPDVVERIDEVPTDGTVYVICAGGGRSAKAVQHFLTLGIDAVNVAGGTKAWVEAGQPVETGG
jgi:rhodanese-related sulfurtransferase